MAVCPVVLILLSGFSVCYSLVVAVARNVFRAEVSGLTHIKLFPIRFSIERLQKDETSSLSQIFDPTIYSMQPLQASNTSANTGNANGKSSTPNNNNSSSPNNNSGGGASDIAYEFDSNSQSEIQTIIGQELSRKYSSASECTTMSDYTPENTITSSMTSSPPIISMNASVSQTPDEPTCQELGQLAGCETNDIKPGANLTLSEAMMAHHQQPATTHQHPHTMPSQQPDESNVSSKRPHSTICVRIKNLHPNRIITVSIVSSVHSIGEKYATSGRCASRRIVERLRGCLRSEGAAGKENLTILG